MPAGSTAREIAIIHTIDEWSVGVDGRGEGVDGRTIGMEQCPNCGSSVRSGAKFCTICGFRLTNGDRAAPVSDTIAPNDADSSIAAVTVTATPDPGDSADVAAAPAAIATWPSSQPPTDDPIVGGEPLGDEADAAVSPPDPDPPNFRDWPVSTWGAPPADSPDPTAPPDSPEPVESTVVEEPLAAPAPTDDAPLAATAPDDETATADAPTTDAPGSGDGPSAPADEFAWWAAPPTDDPAVADAASWFTRDPAPIDSVASSRSSAMRTETERQGAEDDSDLQRANDLLDELRGIVASLATPPASETAEINIDTAVSFLTDARDNTVGPGAESLVAFRAVLADAQAKPNDIRSVLGLVDHLATIAALEATRDRYATAIERALTALQGEP